MKYLYRFAVAAGVIFFPVSVIYDSFLGIAGSITAVVFGCICFLIKKLEDDQQWQKS